MQLNLSVPKCGSLLLNINCNFHDMNNLVLDGNNFLELENVVDLGVTIDNKLTFSQHITSIIS